MSTPRRKLGLNRTRAGQKSARTVFRQAAHHSPDNREEAKRRGTEHRKTEGMTYAAEGTREEWEREEKRRRWRPWIERMMGISAAT
ncbi:hypothetical protein VF21_07661 [Pseudogymnoascus sp. 05NY08]|nr:hypothetical protein VF21_07661 [Pseudogymnoascus sp. 05NY08]